MSQQTPVRVAVIGGARTPFAGAGTAFSKVSPLALSAHAVKGLIDRLSLNPAMIDDLAWGRVIHDPRLPNLAREIVFRLELPATIRAQLVSNNCISGIQALIAVADAIALGRSEVGIAGGVESLSNPPILFGREASGHFIEAARARDPKQKLKALFKLRMRHFYPESLSVREPATGLSMGEHAEISAKEWQVGREEQDAIALRSHQNAAAAIRDGRLAREIVPLNGIDRDTLIRPEASFEALALLPPVFDRSPQGTITAGNASPLCDGAAAVALMSEERAARQGFEPLAFIRGVEFAGIDPDEGLLMAPAVAVPRLLAKTGLTLGEMDIVEVHEAFAAQVACNLAAWARGWKEPAIGAVAGERINPLGGSIAIGHPFAATGARIVTTLAYEMQRRRARYGLVSVCAGGAMAAAMILERPA